LSNKKKLKIAVLLVVSAFVQAFALVNFFENSGLLSGGVTGIGLILDNLTDGAIPLAIFLVVANIPLAFLSFTGVGKRFTVLSFVNIFLTSVFLMMLPQMVFLQDILLNAIVGGVLYGLGIALALEAGASSGGTDFIALYMSVKKQTAAGNYMFLLEGSVILASAFIYNFEIAIYTLLSAFICAKVIDSIHIRYQRVTLAIITSKEDEVVQHLIDNEIHGVTILPAKGGYSKANKSFIYTVVSIYEVDRIQDVVFGIDENAFINVTSSKRVYGYFEPTKYD